MSAWRLPLAVAAVLGFTLIGVPAFAGGSDASTPYTVDEAGITLPAGDVFVDGGHVNVRLVDGTTAGIHFEALNDQPSGEWIGQSFLPWPALGLDPATVCVAWVQLSQFNEHFGEGGQAPVGAGCEPTPTPTVTPSPIPTVTPSPSMTPVPWPTAPPTPSTTPTQEPQPVPEGTGNPVPLPSTYPTPTPTVTALPVPAQLAATGGTPAGWLIPAGLAALAAGAGITLRRGAKR